MWHSFPKRPTSVLNLLERSPTGVARDTFRLDRGGWNRPKERIAPHVPAALHGLTTTSSGSSSPAAAPNRLDFARWLADRRSPLTARVAVNRVWQAMFGTGLVETSEDFGVRARSRSIARCSTGWRSTSWTTAGAISNCSARL